MASGYWEMLRVRHAARLLVGTLIGRLPPATASLAIVFFVRSEGGGYALAGALAAAYGLASAVGQPLLGRLIDLHGQPRVLLPATLASALGMVAFAAVGVGHLGLAYATVLLAGVTTPPLEGALRALWPSVLKRDERIHRAYALDAVAQELIFAGGPLLVMLLVATWSEAAAILVINGLAVLGALSVVVSAPSRAWRSAPREAHWLGALRSPGLLALLGCFLFIGAALGSISVSSVAYADAAGDTLVASWLHSALAVGALIGGLWYGSRQWTGRPERRQLLLAFGLALGYLPLLLVPDSVPLMTALVGVAGLFLAPSLACAFVVIDRHAPSGTVTEAFSWLVTTFGVGTSAGTGLAGPMIEWRGAGAGFAVASASGVGALLVLLAARRALHLPEPRSAPVAGSENDRNAAREPGFRTGHEA